MGISPDKSNVALLEAEKLDIEKHLFLVEKGLYSLTNKLNRFSSLCKKYEEVAATERGRGILRQLKYLKKEIQSLTEMIMHSLTEIEAECSRF